MTRAVRHRANSTTPHPQEGTRFGKANSFNKVQKQQVQTQTQQFSLLRQFLAKLRPNSFHCSVSFWPNPEPTIFAASSISGQTQTQQCSLFRQFLAKLRLNSFHCSGPKGRPDSSDVSPLSESQGCHLIPSFYLHSCYSA